MGSENTERKHNNAVAPDKLVNWMFGDNIHMTDQPQNAASLEFAQALASRNYGKAYSMLSSQLKSKLTVESLREEFEGMIPLDWSPIDAIEVVESPTASDHGHLYT